MVIPVDFLVMCIGNRTAGDDAIGPYLFDKLQKETTSLVAVDCGVTPENHTGTIKRYQPQTLILIDATDMGLSPGEIRIIPKEKLGSMHISTHGMPLSVLMKYVENEVDRLVFIGIQPAALSGPISTPVKKSGQQLIEMLKKKTIEQIPVL